MKQKKIILFFNNLRGLSVLNYLLKKKGIKIVKIILSKKNLNKDILKKIESKKIEYSIFGKEDLFKKKFLSKKVENIDLFVLCGFPYILKKKLFNIPKLGTLNLHAGPLPHYKGGSPLNWQIINGERKIGLSIIKINQKIDDGPLIVQKFFKLGENQDIKDVHQTANKVFPIILYRAIVKIINQKNPFINKNKKTQRYFKQRGEKDGHIKWLKNDENAIYNLVRAITKPYPGAFSYKKNGKKIIFLRVSKTKLFFPELIAGQVYKINGKTYVKTKKGVIKVDNKIGTLKNLEILK